jgi:ribosomally synthesized peptide (two-chain TOMM family)
MSWLKPVNKLSTARAVPSTAPGAPESTGIEGSDFKPGALESSLHWQVIWPRIIAKAWEDATFHQQVKANPRQAIEDHFGYELSTNLKLTIEDAPSDAVFEENDNNPSTPTDPWSKLPPLELTVVIPPPPEARLQAVAITAYQDTGRTYPFTCC